MPIPGAVSLSPVSFSSLEPRGIPLRIYLDSCCVNRLTDDQTQLRIHAEAEAVERILGLVWQGIVDWSASTALELEIRRNPQENKRHDG